MKNYYYFKKRDYWMVKDCKDGKKIYLGCYPTLDDAKNETNRLVRKTRKCEIRENICYIPLSNGMVAMCDAEKHDIVSKYNWSFNRYPMVSKRIKGIEKATTIYLHRLLFPEANMIDHINRNTLDNRACNLRPATDSENQMNKRGPAGVSGYKGACYDKRIKKFFAQISKGRKKIRTHCFISAEEAARAYDKMAVELFGEFACLNFPEEHNIIAPISMKERIKNE